MSKSNSTECGIVQLQIDGLLDNELDPNQQRPALDHIRSCPDCANEYLLARSMRDAMLDMPGPELPPALLAKVFQQAAQEPVSLSDRVRALAAGPWLRLAVPAFAAFAAVAVWLQLDAPSPAEQQVALEDQYTREELVVAIEDLNTTIQTLNEITVSMRSRLGDRMVSLPVLSLPALSIGQPDGGATAPGANDPI